MKQINLKEFYDLVVSRLFEVSTYQKMMCGSIENLGKDAQKDVTQNKIHCSLTYLDQFTQDYLLVPIYEKYPNLIPLVEEDTGLKRNNLNNKSDFSLIMDPIDGTAFYIRGDKDYSIMLGLMHKGEMLLSVICYPEDDLIIGAIKDQGAWTHKKDGTISKLTNINSDEVDYNSIACHYRFEKEPYALLSSTFKKSGYTITSNDNGFGTNATGILRIANGQSCAFIAPHISLHDFAVPAFVIQQLGGTIRLFEYNGLEDLHSWSKILQHYGNPDPKGSNPRYRAIIADTEETIDNIVAKISLLNNGVVQ